jgi:hypothetical protein
LVIRRFASERTPTKVYEQEVLVINDAQNRREFLGMLAGGAALSFHLNSVLAHSQARPPASPANLRLGKERAVIKSSDFEWVGVLKLPLELSNYSWGCLAMRKVDGEIRFFTLDHAYKQNVIEISVPGFGVSLETAPRAAIVKNWGAQR